VKIYTIRVIFLAVITVKVRRRRKGGNAPNWRTP